MLIVERIGYLVNQLRETGTTEIVDKVSSVDLGCDYVLNCSCEKIETATNGTYQYTLLSPYYYFGNVYEVQRILDTKNMQQKRKYPAIILEQLFTNKIYQNERENPTFKIYIVNYSDTEDSYVQRYQNNIKNILYPLWEKLYEEIKKSDMVNSYELQEVNEMPNFAVNKVIEDCWDLLEIKIKILFNKGCNKTFCEKLIYG